MAEKTYDVGKHTLVPKHVKLSQKEKEELLQRYGIQSRDLPKILVTDPALQRLDAAEGDIVKIIRSHSIAGDSVFYRRVSRA
jgi:DNA-directed RNA polymerase subunit H (RpoH/RPB5)